MTSRSKNGPGRLIERAAQLAGQRVARSRLAELKGSDADIADERTVATVFSVWWRAVGLEGMPLRMASPTPADLPFAVYTTRSGWAFVTARAGDGSWRGEDADGAAVSIASLATIQCISLPRRRDSVRTRPTAAGLIRRALWARKGVFVDAVVATALVTLLTLGTSLYSMQVYDRVIPSHGLSTLWVLTGGVCLSIAFEFILKMVRSSALDRACSAIDRELSEWFFARLLGVRMEGRPTAVGTLAAQMKGLELIRSLMVSTSLFVLADVPFALPMLLLVAIVGGWVVAVPVIALAVALFTGVVFQSAIQRQTRVTLTAGNRKVGVLVEAVDGAESVKANGADWMLQSRWNQLTAETSDSDHRVRRYTTLSQNLTMAFQQLTYIALVAVGAYLVTQNQMTMGALLACAVVGNRALSPVVQLPGVMVQWAQAKATVTSLEQVVALANEADDAPLALSPDAIDGSLRFERVRFAYGVGTEVAIEAERLEIPAGERLGLIGPVGSGKSTLLKVASGLYRPADGKVYLGGVDVALLSPLAVRETIGYLPQ